MLGGVRLLLSRTRIHAFKYMTWKIVRVLKGRYLFEMRLRVKRRFPVK